MTLEVAHSELNVVVRVLVAAQALPVAVDEVLGHGEECGGFLQSEGSVRLGGGVTGSGSQQQAGEPLQQVGQLGFRVCLCSGLFGFHIPLSVFVWGGFRQSLWFGPGTATRVASERRVARWARGIVSGPGSAGAEQSALEDAVDVAVDGLADVPK